MLSVHLPFHERHKTPSSDRIWVEQAITRRSEQVYSTPYMLSACMIIFKYIHEIVPIQWCSTYSDRLHEEARIESCS